MLYELIGVVRVGNPLTANKDAKDLVKTIGTLIIQNRGVVRRIMPIGNKLLPKVCKKDHEEHFQGYHFLMLFDSSAGVQTQVLRTMKKDPRMIKSSIVKVDNSKRLDVSSSIERASGQGTIIEQVNFKRELNLS